MFCVGLDSDNWGWDFSACHSPALRSKPGHVSKGFYKCYEHEQCWLNLQRIDIEGLYAQRCHSLRKEKTFEALSQRLHSTFSPQPKVS